LHDQRFPVHSASSSDSSAQSTPVAQLQAALVVAQEGQRAAATNARSAHEKLQASERLHTAATEVAASVDASNTLANAAATAKLEEATRAHALAAAEVTALLTKSDRESEMFQVNCAYLVSRLEDVEESREEVSEAHLAQVHLLRDELDQQRLAAQEVTEDRDRLDLALIRAERALEWLEEHQGGHVCELEAQVDELDGDLNSSREQQSAIKKQLNAATYLLDRATILQRRLAVLPDRVKDVLVRLMAHKSVVLDDFNSESLKLLKLLPDEKALELLHDFFLDRHFESLNISVMINNFSSTSVCGVS
jgi:hypothetical protein